MIKECPECGSKDLVIGNQGNGAGKVLITPFRATNIKHIICADCGLIVESRITNLKLVKNSGKRVVWLGKNITKKETFNNISFFYRCDCSYIETK